MKNLIKFATFISLLIAPLAAHAANGTVNGFCVDGGVKVSTSGMNSTTTVQQSFPKCIVTVYLTGTTTKATIYSDVAGDTLANPFTANTDGKFLFYAGGNSGLDVIISSGTSPNVLPFPLPLYVNIFPSVPNGDPTPVTLQTNGVNNGSQVLLNLVAGSNVTLSNAGGATTINSTGEDTPSFELTAFGDSITASYPLEHIQDDFVYRLGQAINVARVYVVGQVGGLLANSWSGIFGTVSTTSPVKTTIISHELGINDAIQSGFFAGYRATTYFGSGSVLTITSNNNFTPGQQTILSGASNDALAPLFASILTVTSATSSQFTIATSLVTGSGSSAAYVASANQTVDYGLDVSASIAYMEYLGTPYYSPLFGYTNNPNLVLSFTGTWVHAANISGNTAEPGEVCTSGSCVLTANFTGSVLYIATGMSNTYSPSITSAIVCDGASQSVPLYFYGYAGEPLDPSGPKQLGFSRVPLSSGTHTCTVTVSTGADIQFLVAPQPAYLGRIILVNEITPNIATFQPTEAYSSALFRPEQSAAASTMKADGASNITFVPQGTAFPAIPSNFADGVLHPSSLQHDTLARTAFNALKTTLGISGAWNYPAYLGPANAVPGPPSQGVGNYNFGSGSLHALALDTNGNGSTFNTACPNSLGVLQFGDFNTTCGDQSGALLVGYGGSASGLKTITLNAGGSSCTQGQILNVAGGSGGQVQVLSVNGSGTITSLAILPTVNGTGYSTTTGAALSGGSCTGASINITAIGPSPAHAQSNTIYGENALGNALLTGQNTVTGVSSLATMRGGFGRNTTCGYNALTLYAPYPASSLEGGNTACGYNVGLSSTNPYSVGLYHLASNGETDTNFSLFGEFAGKSSPFVLTDDFAAFGNLASVSNDDSGEFGHGINRFGHTFAFRGASFVDDVGNLNTKMVNVPMATIASTSTIAPTSGFVSVTGTSSISTITPPTLPWGNGSTLLGSGATTYSVSGGVVTVSFSGPQNPVPFAGQVVEFVVGGSDPLFPLVGIPFTLTAGSSTSLTFNSNLITGSGSTGADYISPSTTAPFQGCITLVASGAWKLITGGNINSNYTPTIGSTVGLCYNPTTSLWDLPDARMVGSVSLGGSSLAANACSTGSVTIAGAVVGDSVVITPSVDPNASGTLSYTWYGTVTSPNVIQANLCALTLGTPASSTYNLRVLP